VDTSIRYLTNHTNLNLTFSQHY